MYNMYIRYMDSQWLYSDITPNCVDHCSKCIEHYNTSSKILLCHIELIAMLVWYTCTDDHATI